MSDPVCVDPNHFQVIDGAIVPQPWMQYRNVASASVPTVTGSYPVSSSDTTATSLNLNSIGSIGQNFVDTIESSLATIGLGQQLGGLLGLGSGLTQGIPALNKNDLLQSVKASWTNDTPIDQLVYGLITRGGSRVTLQARSRGYVAVASGYAIGADVTQLTICSKMGTGADMGAGGTLATGTDYGIAESRQNSCTIPLAPELTGWTTLAPGATFNGAVQVRFISEFWENTSITGGDADTESSYETGELQLDLYALPVI